MVKYYTTVNKFLYKEVFCDKYQVFRYMFPLQEWALLHTAPANIMRDDSVFTEISEEEAFLIAL